MELENWKNEDDQKEFRGEGWKDDSFGEVLAAPEFRSQHPCKKLGVEARACDPSTGMQRWEDPGSSLINKPNQSEL